MQNKLTKILSILLCFLLIVEQSSFAQVAGELNIAGYLAQLHSSLATDVFRPLHLRYLAYNLLENNFQLFLDKGNTNNPTTEELETSTKILLNYFFVGVALPNDSFWVNLRPDSPDNIIDDYLAQTDIAKIMLEADLQLKKDTAKATSPETPEGKLYWDKLYKKADELFGSENITIPTLTRPWIVPGEIIIRETLDSAYIYKATLKVMLEQDYLKDSAIYNFTDPRLKVLNEYSSQLIRELIIPRLTKEVNTSKRYANLRQVYYSLILAQWFKARFYGKSGLYSSSINKKDLTNLTSKQTWSKETYFKAYQKSFKEGEYNIQQPVYTPYGQSIRSYFSGGMQLMPKPEELAPFGNPKHVSSPISALPASSSPVLHHNEVAMNIKATPEPRIVSVRMVSGPQETESLVDMKYTQTQEKDSSPVRIDSQQTKENITWVDKARGFFAKFSSTSRLHNKLLKAIEKNDVEKIKETLGEIFGKQYGYFSSRDDEARTNEAFDIYEAYPQGFARCLEAGLNLRQEMQQVEQDDILGIAAVARDLRTLAEVFQFSITAGNELLKKRGNKTEYEYTLREIRIEREQGVDGKQLAIFLRETGIDEYEANRIMSLAPHKDTLRRLHWARQNNFDLKQLIYFYRLYPAAVELSIDLAKYQPSETLMAQLAYWLGRDAQKTKGALRQGIRLEELDRYLRLENYFGRDVALRIMRNMKEEATRNGWITTTEAPRDISDLDKINKTGGLKATDLILVHRTNYPPQKGTVVTTTNAIGWGARQTVHFTLNHPVSAHEFGSWEGKGYTILIPLHGIRRERVENILPADTYILGDVELPEGSLVLGVKGQAFPEPEALGKAKYVEIEPTREAIEGVISDLGYTVKEAGKEQWEDYGESTREFGKVENIPHHSLHMYTWHHRYEALLHFDVESFITQKIVELVDPVFGKSARDDTLDGSINILSYLREALLAQLITTRDFCNRDYIVANRIPDSSREDVVRLLRAFFDYAGTQEVDIEKMLVGSDTELADTAAELSRNILRVWIDKNLGNNQTLTEPFKRLEARARKYNQNYKLSINNEYLDEVEQRLRAFTSSPLSESQRSQPIINFESVSSPAKNVDEILVSIASISGVQTAKELDDLGSAITNDILDALDNRAITPAKKDELFGALNEARRSKESSLISPEGVRQQLQLLSERLGNIRKTMGEYRDSVDHLNQLQLQIMDKVVEHLSKLQTWCINRGYRDSFLQAGQLNTDAVVLAGEINDRIQYLETQQSGSASVSYPEEVNPAISTPPRINSKTDAVASSPMVEKWRDALSRVFKKGQEDYIIKLNRHLNNIKTLLSQVTKVARTGIPIEKARFSAILPGESEEKILAFVEVEVKHNFTEKLHCLIVLNPKDMQVEKLYIPVGSNENGEDYLALDENLVEPSLLDAARQLKQLFLDGYDPSKYITETRLWETTTSYPRSPGTPLLAYGHSSDSQKETSAMVERNTLLRHLLSLRYAEGLTLGGDILRLSQAPFVGGVARLSEGRIYGSPATLYLVATNGRKEDVWLGMGYSHSIGSLARFSHELAHVILDNIEANDPALYAKIIEALTRLYPTYKQKLDGDKEDELFSYIIQALSLVRKGIDLYNIDKIQEPVYKEAVEFLIQSGIIPTEMLEMGNFKAKLSSGVSSPVKTFSPGEVQNLNMHPGGIDFRVLPIVTQAIGNLSANVTSQSTINLSSLNLNQEWQQIQKMLAANIRPSAERLKEYVQASAVKGSLPEESNKVILAISDILRQEEENCSSTDPILSDMLVVLESGSSTEELKTIFTGTKL